MSRPEILSAKIERHSLIVADADRLKAMAKSDRPDQAPLDDVRREYCHAMEDLADVGGSVAAVESVPLPSDRLGSG